MTRNILAPKIIYEDESFVVVDKPAGMLTTSTDQRASLHDWVREKVATAHPLSRLDHPVSGAVLFSKNKRATARAQAFRKRGAHRFYLAIVATTTETLKSSGTWERSIAVHKRDKRLRCVSLSEGDPSSKSARTDFRVLSSSEAIGDH